MKRLTATRSAGIPFVVGVATTFASLWCSPSVDEAAWLGVVRKWAGGAHLYRDAIDNKSPGLFAVVRALDIRHAYVPLRAIFIGALVAWLVWSSAALAERLGMSRRTSVALGAVIGITAAMQSVFSLTPELIVAAVTLLGFLTVASGRGALGGAVVASGVVFDPRAFALVPAAVGLAVVMEGRRAPLRTAAAAVAIIAVWAVVVAVERDLRFALVDLNVTTGVLEPVSPARVLVVALEAMLFPIVGAALVVGPREPSDVRPRVTRTVLVVAVAPAIAAVLASVHGYDHYWTITLPLAPLVVAALSRPDITAAGLRARVAVLVIAAIPGLVHAGVAAADARTNVRVYAAVAARLRARLLSTQTYIQFDASPYLGMTLPLQLGARSPLLGYLIQPTPRRSAELSAFALASDHASAITDAGGLEVPDSAVLPAFRDVWRILESRLSEFPCREKVDGITIHWQRALCPAG